MRAAEAVAVQGLVRESRHALVWLERLLGSWPLHEVQRRSPKARAARAEFTNRVLDAMPNNCGGRASLRRAIEAVEATTARKAVR